MTRRGVDNCPIAGALQIVGDKWTLLIVRDLAHGARRTGELLSALHPISSRTLLIRLRDMERDLMLERRRLGGNPPHVEYALTAHGRKLLPLLDALRQVGQALGCDDCEERRRTSGSYCEVCTHHQTRTPKNHNRPRPADDFNVLW
ncbi:MAG: helix-turn-helix transcriptional regulator [Pyrinomonadaceae bacterium MAG19_C2-C3]|nr:helix-turn-helix transcriptional regulator [Pyrinomonadaceae bacterium MAG19_C2-C3]